MFETMSLGELIAALQRKDQEAEVRLDFAYYRPSGWLHSYRGVYEQLALDYDDKTEITVGQLVAKLKDAIGKTFHGWKGGEYTMDEDTPVWVDKDRDASSTAIVDVETTGWCVTIRTKRVSV